MCRPQTPVNYIKVVHADPMRRQISEGLRLEFDGGLEHLLVLVKAGGVVDGRSSEPMGVQG